MSPDTRNKRKRDAALQHGDSVFRPRRPQKTYTHTLQDDLILQARTSTAEGSSSTLGINYTFGGF
jgi:hypothetical protein